jgi:hypothetical protein
MASLHTAITRFLAWMDAPRRDYGPAGFKPVDAPEPLSFDPDSAEGFSWLIPPHNTADPAAWDEYWTNQLTHGIGPALYDMFSDDRELLAAMRGLQIQTILCAGSGVSLEPCALAAASFRVIALDNSPQALAIAQARPAGPEHLEIFLDEQSHKAGGNVAYVVGDLFDPAIAPGPFDVIIERRTLQNYVEPAFSQLLAALIARLSPEGIFLTHCHDSRWRPPAQPRHVTSSWWLAQGGVLWSGGFPKPTGRVAWPVTSTG